MGGRWAIAFVQRGGFSITHDGKTTPLEAGSVLLTWPGMAFRCAHGASCPDDVCLAIGVAPEAVAGHEHAWHRAGWAARGHAAPRLAYVQRRLALAADTADAFELERWGVAGVSALAADSTDARARGHYAVGRREVDAVVTVSRAIEADPAARTSVAARAREVGMTSTTLTHAFRRYLGVSPHQYAVRHRLVAATMLLDRGHSVSDASLRAGFENLSHFCRTFQRAFAVRPSQWRHDRSPQIRRKVQAFRGGGS